LTFVLAACVFPDAVKKAQEELDRVIGADRSPVLDDIGSLPYCSAFVKEMCVASLTVCSHRVSDVAQHAMAAGGPGWRSPSVDQGRALQGARSSLPIRTLTAPRVTSYPLAPLSLEISGVLARCKKAVRLISCRGILHDPDSYDDPESFRPERFLQHTYGLKADVNKDEVWVRRRPSPHMPALH
jgi:hypothetical protein